MMMASTDSDHEPTLMEEMVEAVALANLIFTLADLRLLSATGRIQTKFETIAVESDFKTRTTACQLAGIADTCAQKTKTDTTEAVPDSTAAQDRWLSPAHILAVILLEMHETVDTRNNEAKSDTDNTGAKPDRESNYGPLTGFLEKSSVGRDGMNKLLQEYADLVGRDLKTNIPSIKARQSVRILARSSTIPTHLCADPKEDDLCNDKEEELFSTVLPAFKGLQHRLSMQNLRKHGRKYEKTQAEVAHAVFGMGETHTELQKSIGGNSLVLHPVNEDELVKILKRAVLSRVHNKLDFMTQLFREGTLSDLVIRSNARIVWINDWFPLKELTYAIAVDKVKRRVLVVFRGAITTMDWKKSFSLRQKKVTNPIKENYEGKSERINLHRGFFDYLFMVRKDTGTTKFDEIANVAQKYGLEIIGEDYQLEVTGHSLGAALSTVFSFYASCLPDERFTKDKPIKVLTFGSPKIGCHAFEDSFRHQEERKKLQYARFFNHNDIFAYLPPMFGFRKGGTKYRHVGIGVRVKPIPSRFCFTGKYTSRKTEIFYVKKEGHWLSWFRALESNAFFHPSIDPNRMHTLQEMMRRIMDGSVTEERSKAYEHLEKPLSKLYDMFGVTSND